MSAEFIKLPLHHDRDSAPYAYVRPGFVANVFAFPSGKEGSMVALFNGLALNCSLPAQEVLDLLDPYGGHADDS